MSPGPAAPEASTVPLGYRGGGATVNHIWVFANFHSYKLALLLGLFSDATWRIDAQCWMVKEIGHGNICKEIVAHLVLTASAGNISF